MTKQAIKDPNLEEQAALLRQQMQGLQDARMAEEQAGIDEYSKNLLEAETKKQNIDWRPLAGLLDQWAGGSSASKAAQAVAPEAIPDRENRFQNMRTKLQDMKGGLSSSQYAALKAQLDSINSQMGQKAAEARLSASISGKNDTQERLRERDNDKDLMEFQKRIQPFEKVDNVLNDVEKNLGFNLSEFDPKTSTVRGEKTDAPGVSVPLLGRLNQATPESRQFKASLQRLLNTVLKERSGAAVTDSEQHRLLTEFAANRGRFNTEADLLATLRSYGELLNSDKQAVIAGFRPHIPETYYGQKKSAQSYKRQGGATQAPQNQNLQNAALEEIKRRQGNK